MRLVVRVLGAEVLAVEWGQAEPEEPPGEGDGVEVVRHAGDFALGFGSRQPGWSDTDLPAPP